MPDYLDYLSSNQDVAFPFADDAPGLARATAASVSPARLPRAFLLDLVAVLPAQSLVGDLYLLRIEVDSATAFELVFGDGYGDVAAVPVDLDESPVYGTVLQFVSSTVTLRLVAGDAFPTYLATVAAALSNSGTLNFALTLPLVPAAVEFRGARVDSLKVGETTISLGDVGLVAGYNMAITREGQRITIAAGVGAGLGRRPGDCEDDEEEPLPAILNRLGQAAPDEHGNVELIGGNCWRIVPDPANNRLLFYNDCEPCCTCEDYARASNGVTKRLKRIAALWQGDALALPAGYHNVQKLAETTDEHIHIYNEEILPLLMSLKINAAFSHGNAEGAGKSDTYGVITLSIRSDIVDDDATSITGTISGNRTLGLYSSTTGGAGSLSVSQAGGGLSISGSLARGQTASAQITVKAGAEESYVGGSFTLTLNWTQHGAAKTRAIALS